MLAKRSAAARYAALSPLAPSHRLIALGVGDVHNGESDANR